MSILGIAPSKASAINQVPDNGLQQTQHETSEDAKKLAANALAAVRDAAAADSGRGKVEVKPYCQHHVIIFIIID
jgi:hypothetical protein